MGRYFYYFLQRVMLGGATQRRHDIFKLLQSRSFFFRTRRLYFEDAQLHFYVIFLVKKFSRMH